MAKTKSKLKTWQGQGQKSRGPVNRVPRLIDHGTSSMIKYASYGNGLNTDGLGNGATYRLYCPGASLGLTGPGPGLVANYSTAKFLPGTMAKWIPTVGTVTPGRIFVAWCDNPEINKNLYLAWFAYDSSPGSTTYSNYANLVRSIGDCRAYTVYNEAIFTMPTKMRRKVYDTNITIDSGTPVFDYDRCVQYGMWVCTDGGATGTGMGVFEFHDNVQAFDITAPNLT